MFQNTLQMYKTIIIPTKIIRKKDKKSVKLAKLTPFVKKTVIFFDRNKNLP